MATVVDNPGLNHRDLKTWLSIGSSDKPNYPSTPPISSSMRQRLWVESSLKWLVPSIPVDFQGSVMITNHLLS